MSVEEWLAAHSGVVRRSVAVAATGDLAGFRREVRAGRLVKITHDIYLRASAVRGAIDLAARAGALADACGPDAFASCATAAELHGLSTLHCCPAVHLTRPPGRGHLAFRTADVDLRLASLPAWHVTALAGVPAVTAARAVVDVARTRPFAEGLVAADSALRQGLARSLLHEVLSDCAGWPGVNRARGVVEFADGRAESALESVGRWAMRCGGLPMPELQHWLVGASGRRYRVDYWFEGHLTAGEADGLAKYRDVDRDVAQAQHDRDADIADAGVEIVHFNWSDAFVRSPEHLTARFRRAFARAAARRRAS